MSQDERKDRNSNLTLLPSAEHKPMELDLATLDAARRSLDQDAVRVRPG